MTIALDKLQENSVRKLAIEARKEFFASTYTNATVAFVNVTTQTNAERNVGACANDANTIYSFDLLKRFAEEYPDNVKAEPGLPGVEPRRYNDASFIVPQINQVADYRCSQYIGVAKTLGPKITADQCTSGSNCDGLMSSWDYPVSLSDTLLKRYTGNCKKSQAFMENSFDGAWTPGVGARGSNVNSLWGEGQCNYTNFANFPVHQKEPMVPFYKMQIPQVDEQVCYGNGVCIKTSANGLAGGLADHKNYGGRSGIRFNVASRKSSKEALAHAQSACFVAIVVVQWADLTICKTRMNSIRDQGMSNAIMNFALIFETLLAAFLCYTPVLSGGLGTRPLRVTHWLPAVPFCIFIFAFDEIRKGCMRSTTKITINKVTGAVERDPAWLERNTYY